MSHDNLLKRYEIDDLRPARTADVPRLGDQVEFSLRDGSGGAQGRVSKELGQGWLKVRVDGVGSFAVAPGRLTLVARAA